MILVTQRSTRYLVCYVARVGQFIAMEVRAAALYSDEMRFLWFGCHRLVIDTTTILLLAPLVLYIVCVAHHQ